jgi:hypothetical protein
MTSLVQRLDAMGWTKVLVDVRQHLFRLPWPLCRYPRPSPPSSSSSFSAQDNTIRVTLFDATRQLVTSRQLVASQLQSHYCHVPFGHTVLVANAKNSIYRHLNKGGKPIMERLARKLVQELLEMSE